MAVLVRFGFGVILREIVTLSVTVEVVVFVGGSPVFVKVDVFFVMVMFAVCDSITDVDSDALRLWLSERELSSVSVTLLL